MTYAVRFTEEATDDLMRLIDFLAVQDIAAARQAHAAISEAVRFLTIFPFSCRKAAANNRGQTTNIFRNPSVRAPSRPKVLGTPHQC